MGLLDRSRSLDHGSWHTRKYRHVPANVKIPKAREFLTGRRRKIPENSLVIPSLVPDYSVPKEEVCIGTSIPKQNHHIFELKSQGYDFPFLKNPKIGRNVSVLAYSVSACI